MTAPNWLVAARVSRLPRGPIQHAVRNGRALCGIPTNAGWKASEPGQARCWRCVVATSPELVTYADLVRTGITYRQVDYWCRRGYLRCAVPAKGSGSQRLFARGEVEIAAAMARLVAAGVSPEAAARGARTGYLADGVRVVVTDAVDLDVDGDIGVAS